MFDIYSQLGGLGQDSMQLELQKDFADLEEIIGELNYEEMAVLKSTNPGLFVIIVQKVFNFLMYLARIPTTNEDGEKVDLNLYEEALDTLFEKNVVDGEVPDWLNKLKTCFDWGKKFAKIVDKAQSGELADELQDIIPMELSMTFISIPSDLDNMLI